MIRLILILKILVLTGISSFLHAKHENNFFSLNVEWQGIDREYLIYLPEEYYEEPNMSFPLIVGLHGYVGTASGFERETSKGMNLHAEKENYITVYPQGSHFNNKDNKKSSFVSSWNDVVSNAEPEPGMPPSCSHQKSVSPKPTECKKFGNCAWTSCYDDLGFLKWLIEEISEKYRVDISRRYMVGLSNGGAMTHRFACTYPEMISAAVAVVPSIAIGRSCTPSSSMPYLQIVGDNDQVIPLDGSKAESGFYYDTPFKTFNLWADSMQCKDQSRDSLSLAKKSGLNCHTRNNCTNSRHEVINCIVPGGAHSWPGQTSDAGYCRDNIQKDSVPNYFNCLKPYPVEINWGNEVIWEFLKNHRKNK